jgi:DNA-directed RNA polymerase subunit RPC12/RpoP
MVKFCSNCGTQVEDTAQFCSKCGSKISLEPNPQQQSPVPVVPDSKTSTTTDKWKSAGKWIAICCGGAIICVVIAAFVYGMAGGSTSGASGVSSTPTLSIADIKSQAQIIPYTSLMRNPDTYKGSIVYFRGKILQVQQKSNNNYILRIATKEDSYLGYYDNVIYVDYYSSNRVLEDDVVDIWGKFVGLKTYQAVLGNDITIPEVNALHYEMVKAVT